MSDFPIEQMDFPDNQENAEEYSCVMRDPETKMLDVQGQVVADVSSDLLQRGDDITIGYPDDLIVFWHFQGPTADCGLYSQGSILEADGKDFDITKYRQQGMDEGWYYPGQGTDTGHFGDLLEDNGMAVDQFENASFQDMANALSDRKGVLVAVDCEPIWGQPGGHALWVTGMEVTDDGTPVSVICNDSGRPDGREVAYPFSDFAEAWSNYGNMMVTTQQPLGSLS
jgi:hypothetical protein